MAVGRKRYVRRINPHADRFDNGLSGMIEAAGCAGCDVNPAALLAELNSRIKNVADTAAMGRTNMLDREPLGQDLVIHFEGTRNIARVNMQETGLAGNHCADTNLSEHSKNLLRRRE